MIIVEALRLRRWSIGWATIISVIAVLIALAVQHAITTVEVNGTHWSAMNVPLSGFSALAMFLTMIYASGAGTSLGNEGQTLALSWTKPVPRVVIAARIVAVDLIAIAAANAFAWLVILGLVATARGSVALDPGEGASIVLGLGVAVMWYALVAALTSALPAGGGMVQGFLWPAAIVISDLRGPFGTLFDGIVAALNVINPLAYTQLSFSSTSNLNATATYWQAPLDERALMVWVLAAALIAVAIGLWTRREA